MYLPVGITEEEHREQVLALKRRQIALLEKQVEQRGRNRFWAAIGAISAASLPILAFLGIKRLADIK